MNRSETNNNWYQGDMSAWYSPAPRQTYPTAKPRKKHTGMKITTLSICMVILVAATALLAGGYDGIFGIHHDDPALSSPGVGTKPDLPDISGTDDADESDYPEDYRDFFDNFYISSEETLPSNLKTAPVNPAISIELASSNEREELDYNSLYAKCIDSIVGIQALYDGVDGYGWGSGIIISEDGYIITNSHVISQADNARVVLSDGSEYDALLVGEDTQSDIAVLKIDAGSKKLSPAEFGNSNELSVGDGVVAIGNPLGIEFSGTLTDGIISAIDRDMDYNGATLSLLQTNAAINEGNSGGPLINMYGQVVGITNMKMVNTTSATIEGIGFAIPSATVKEIADQLMARGRVTGRPGIGITCGAIPQYAIEYYGLTSGLYIVSVVEGSDAAAKGVMAGDILTHINGQSVSTTDDVLTIRDACQVGDTLTFTIYRNGEIFDVDVELYDQNDLK